MCKSKNKTLISKNGFQFRKYLNINLFTIIYIYLKLRNIKLEN